MSTCTAGVFGPMQCLTCIGISANQCTSCESIGRNAYLHQGTCVLQWCKGVSVERICALTAAIPIPSHVTGPVSPIPPHGAAS